MISKVFAAAAFMFVMPFFVSAQTPPVFDTLPDEIKTLLQKDPSTLTADEQTKILPFTTQLSLLRPSVPVPEGAVACFDYYRFGSVQVDVSPTLTQTIPGVPIIFTGKIKNTNDYPIVNGQVYAKIFYTGKENSLFTQQNGYPLVDFFLVKDTISINGKSEQDIIFDWQVPSYAQGGEYNISLFFTSAKRYSLLGLTFTDDVVGNQAAFSVTANNPILPITFEKTNVKLNNTDFRFASPPPTFTKDEQVTAFVTLTNPNDIESTVSVTWITSEWDGILKEGEKKRETESVSLKPRESKALSYAPPILDATVTYLVAEVSDRDTKSILNIRFVRNGIEETVLTLPAVTNYPLTAGEENTLFSCANSTNLPIVKDTTITLTLKDTGGEVIENYVYMGDITGDMMGVKKNFTPTKTYADFSLTATMERHGKVLGQVTQKYSCQDIDASLCPKEDNPPDSFVAGKIMKWILICLTLFSFVLILLRTFKGRSSSGTLLIIFFAVTLSFFGGVEEADAKTVAFSPGAALSPRDGCAGLNGMTYSVLYKANVYNISAGGVLLNDGDSIPVGTQIRFQDGPYLDSDINWNGTGWYSASPYGVWMNEADIPSFGKFVNIPYFGIPDYFALSVEPPQNVTVSHSGTAGLSCDASGMICTVTSAGSIISQVKFDNRSSQKLYRYDSSCDQGYITDFTGVSLAEYAVYGYDKYSSGKSVNVWNGNATFAYAVPLTANLNVPINSEFITAINGDQYPYVNDTGIPDQSILFNLIAVGGNSSPNAPTVTPQPFTGSTNTAYPFTFTATDADNDTIRYAIDWDNNGIVDQYAPFFGFVASGTARTASNPFFLWSTSGIHTFMVRAEDNRGGISAWTTATVNLTGGPTLVFTASPTSIVSGGSSTLTWTTTNAFSCWASGDWTGWTATSGVSVQSLVTTKTFTLECWSFFGVSSGQQSVTVTVTASPVPIVDLKVNGSDGPVSLNQGDTKNISWTTSNATSCTASSSDGWFGGKSVPSGSESLTANTTSNHTLTCSGPGGSASDSVQVNVSCIENIGAYGACDCSTETKTRTNTSAACLPWTETVACDFAEKNSCRDYNWREVAP